MYLKVGSCGDEGLVSNMYEQVIIYVDRMTRLKTTLPYILYHRDQVSVYGTVAVQVELLGKLV